MFVDFFIRRPIFATVSSLIIVLAGLASLPTLPLSEYPEISPPKVSVSATYTGANAAVVETSVTGLIEQQINGATGIKYIQSASGNDGAASVNLTFDLDRNIDLAAVDVQSRIAAIEGRLPDEVKRTGVSVTKVSTAFVLAVGLGSADDRYTSQFLSNFADLYLKDALKRVPGVGDVRIFGERKYSMRIWLDPHRMAQFKLTAPDVVRAIAEQNIQVAAGQIGQPPVTSDQSYQMSVSAPGRLKTAAEFDNIILRTSGHGSIIRLRDVGRAELGAEDYQTIVRYRGREAVGLGIFQRPGANALAVSAGVREEMKKLARRFPPGMQYDFAFDTTLSVRESIREVLWTLAQAVALVVLVIFLFLQNWKSTLIPAVTIPVSLIGTFAFMKLFGFSINTLTLFGITLATGLVVDDAIVVIENIARFIEQKKLDPRAAASAAIAEVTGAVIAISLVLVAVFVPVAFYPGTTGQLYKQFALTIASSVAISTFIALTLAPALSALWLGEWKAGAKESAWNAAFASLAAIYSRSLSYVLRWRPVAIAVFAALGGLTYALFHIVPSGFIPSEDQGYFITVIKAPEGASLSYTAAVLGRVEKELARVPEIESAFGIAGFGFSGSSPNNGIVFANLKPWESRREKESALDSVIERLRLPLSAISEATVVPFNPPQIEGMGNFGGFVFELQDLNGGPPPALARVTRDLCRAANGQPELTGVFSDFSAASPQLTVKIDRDRAKILGVNLADVFTTLNAYLGSYYVNDFDMGTRVYRVYVQADQKFRANPRDIGQFYVRSAGGEMIPLSSLVAVSTATAPQTINHYNLFCATEINGSAAPGVSSGQAIEAMERVARQVLPEGFAWEWSGISLEEIEAGGRAAIIFALGFVFVFLVLAAQYESFVDPFVILFAVPLAILGALSAQWLCGLENDVFCQIGLVMLIGLASKNSILIVEFANKLRAGGLSPAEAVSRAAAIRLRPIMMTTLAFVMGIAPLVLARGAGAESRHSLGTAVCGGMIVSSLLSLYFVPVIYVSIAESVARLARLLPARRDLHEDRE